MSVRGLSWGWGRSLGEGAAWVGAMYTTDASATACGCLLHACPNDTQGYEGVVVRVADTYEGVSISATHPFKVELTVKVGEKERAFATHFVADELEAIE